MPPLPDPKAIRRNAPTIPTTALPVAGRGGLAPEVPSWVELGESGRAWWEWAWSTPQACAWGDGVGQEACVARRASLEDDLATREFVHNLDLLDDEFQSDTAKALKDAITRLASLATGRLAIQKEMRELDDRLGLTPKAMAQLRWEIVGDKPAAQVAGDELQQARSRRARVVNE